MAQTPRELTPYLSLRHFFGAELRQWRLRAGLSHDRLGAEINYSGDTIGKVEKAERVPTVPLAEACDRVLDTGGVLARLVALSNNMAHEAVHAGGQASFATAGDAPRGGRGELTAFQPLPNGHGPTVGEAARSSARGEDPVKRFEFLVSLFGLGAGFLVGSREGTEPSRLGSEDVERWRRCLSRLYELDDQYGGGAVYDLAQRSLRQLRRVMHRASYGEATGTELHTVVGELTRHTGWLAFDTGRQAEARYWWLEASHTARFVDDDRLFVAVLRLMSRQAYELGQPREAIEVAQAAQQAAKPWGTPRLHSLLLAREALGHARDGDKRATWHVFHQAGTLLGAGRHNDDPSWLDFWNEADIASCETLAAQSLGELPLAERCTNKALAAVGLAYPRNRASYLAKRAEVLIELRRIDEAVSTAAQAVEAGTEVSSARVDAGIDRVRAELARYSANPEVAEFLDWSAEVLATKANMSETGI
ncbi:MAG: helix-turn-helix domain-containing protein [Pseudonocardiaceae bacterium]